MNYNKNDLINECLKKYYQTFNCTLDTADYVPDKYNNKILAYIFKNMKKQFKKIDMEDKIYQKTIKKLEKGRKKMTKKNKQLQLFPVLVKNHKDSKGGHPHLIMDDIDNKHVSVGLTTNSKKGESKKAGKNFKMESSPLNDGKTSYMRRQAIVAPQSQYDKPRKGNITERDYNQAKGYAEKAKQKYINKK